MEERTIGPPDIGDEPRLSAFGDLGSLACALDFKEFGHCYVQAAKTGKKKSQEKYVVVDSATEERASTELVTTKAFFEGTEEQKQKCFAAAEKEVGQMLEQKVWKEVRESEARDVLELGPDEPLPSVLPTQLVMAKKPDLEEEVKVLEGAHQASISAEAAFKARVRLVACGNFQPGQEIDKTEIECENLSPEVPRLVYGRLASEQDWEGLTLDISAAFLNSALPKHKRILLRPPSVLVKLGLIPAGVPPWAQKSIYGLRRGPKDWQSERSEKLHEAKMRPRHGDAHGELVLEELDECRGLFVVRETATCKICRIVAMFVDDGVMFGPREVMLRAKALIAGTWKCQVQGFLTRTDDTLIQDGAEETKRVDEVTFLGTQVTLQADGVHVSQRKWLVRELHRRGMVHLRGTGSLPTTDV